ncbi:flagellar export chaperone FlgN [Treponema pectinovorum]|uniref:flagellar export chaperone FlgN n=1 Tax=Treponema pectinovorum TaxID=164 RepID=UPI0011C7A9D9|nr:flagellar export chaperone FlgN [Treponema pectinovorum]
MELTNAEFEERVAILRRFKTLLEQQRNKFREYLLVLEKQQDKIEREDGDSLVAQTELEQQIVSNISCLQKVIEPMQSMYNSVSSKNLVSTEDKASVQQMQGELASLQQKVLEQNAKNRQLLKNHIEQIKEQLLNLKKSNPYFGKRSVYSQSKSVTSTFAIQA